MFATLPPQPANPTASFALIGAIIAGFRRHQPIGGWLFFFFWAIFVGLAITLINVFGERIYLLPARWGNQTRYLLYMLALGPRVASLIFVAAASAVSLSRRNSQAISTLRLALTTYMISQFVTVGIDAYAFRGSLNTAVAGLVFPTAFLLYSIRSSRVDRVFNRR